MLREWIYYDDAGKTLYQWRAWANGKLTDFEQYTAAGWKEINKYLSTTGRWVSQTLDWAGQVLREWIYYDDAGKTLYQWRAWANGKLTDFEQYTSAGWRELDKWLVQSGRVGLPRWKPICHTFWLTYFTTISGRNATCQGGLPRSSSPSGNRNCSTP